VVKRSDDDDDYGYGKAEVGTVREKRRGEKIREVKEQKERRCRCAKR
jgi:hypothetical protein